MPGPARPLLTLYASRPTRQQVVKNDGCDNHLPFLQTEPLRNAHGAMIVPAHRTVSLVPVSAPILEYEVVDPLLRAFDNYRMSQQMSQPSSQMQQHRSVAHKPFRQPPPPSLPF